MMPSIVFIIPALNEEETIGDVLEELKGNKVIVVDNGSEDDTAKIAREKGGKVIFEQQRGYGAACLKGISKAKADILIFLDADGSDRIDEWQLLANHIIENNYDLVIGSRLLKRNPVLPVHQRFGNKLAGFLISLIYKQKVTDLGPFRAIKKTSLDKLNMQDKDFGWTVEMQLKAFRYGLKVKEVPVSYYDRKGGKSKISGTLKGSFLAGKKILSLIFKELVWKKSL